jgi:hypothetical protein
MGDAFIPVARTFLRPTKANKMRESSVNGYAP